MTTEQPATLQLSSRALYLTLTGALVCAGIIVVCFVLPAEFRVDPTGVGRLTGVLSLAAPKQVTASEAIAAAPDTAAADRYYESGYRADEVEIPLAADAGPNGSELEYKVRLKAGATLVYSWKVSGLSDPEMFYFDFHGEGGGKVSAGDSQVIEYKQATGLASSGMLVAPFDGIYGWYLQNQSENPTTVKLKISGFYELIPPGQYGNEANIQATGVSR